MMFALLVAGRRAALQPTGVGEPGAVPVAAPLVNALFDATADVSRPAARAHTASECAWPRASRVLHLARDDARHDKADAEPARAMHEFAGAHRGTKRRDTLPRCAQALLPESDVPPFGTRQPPLYDAPARIRSIFARAAQTRRCRAPGRLIQGAHDGNDTAGSSSRAGEVRRSATPARVRISAHHRHGLASVSLER